MTLTSTMAPSYVNWTLDQLDQTNTGQHAVLTVINDVATNIQQIFMARIIANGATTSGGTSGNSTTVTLDQPLPGTNYNSYRLYALSPGGNVVYRRYLVCNQHVANQMQQYFPYPFAFSFANNTAAVMTSAPLCNVFWSADGNPPYNMSSIGVVIDPDAGTITTVSPTSLVFGGGVVTPPTDVQVFVPVATGCLEVFAPAATLFHRDGRAHRGNLPDQGRDLPGLDRLLEYPEHASVRERTPAIDVRCRARGVNQLPGPGHGVPESRPGRPDHGHDATSRAGRAAGSRIPRSSPAGRVTTGRRRLSVSGTGTSGALSHITTNGVITSVWVSTRGSGYTGTPTVNVTGGSGVGREHHAPVRGPAGGVHGRPVPAGARGHELRQHAAPLEPAGTLHQRNLRSAGPTRSKAGRPVRGRLWRGLGAGGWAGQTSAAARWARSTRPRRGIQARRQSPRSPRPA